MAMPSSTLMASASSGIQRPATTSFFDGQLGAVGEVKFTIDQAFGAVVGVVIGRRWLAIDRHQAVHGSWGTSRRRLNARAV